MEGYLVIISTPGVDLITNGLLYVDALVVSQCRCVAFQAMANDNEK